MSLRTPKALVLLAAVSTFASGASAQETREYINGRSATQANVPPFSGAVLVGNTLYLSGTLGLDPGQQRPATAEAEARNVLNSMRTTLEAADMTMDDLVSVQIFSSDVADYAAFNGVYRSFFTQEFPARAFLGAGTLLFNARFEVMGIAVKR